MADLTPYLSAIVVASDVQDITGNLSASAIAGGYASWIEAVTGQPPQVVRADTNRARLEYSPAQTQAMQAWLDAQVRKPLLERQKVPPIVDYNLAPILTPWAMKYALPAGLLIFLAGVGSMWALSRL